MSVYDGDKVISPSTAELFAADGFKISEPPDTEAYKMFYAKAAKKVDELLATPYSVAEETQELQYTSDTTDSTIEG